MLPFPSNNHSNKRSRLLTEHFLCAQHYWSTLGGRSPGTHSTHGWWELLYPLQQMRKLLPSPTLVTLMPLIPSPFSFSSSTHPLLTCYIIHLLCWFIFYRLSLHSRTYVLQGQISLCVHCHMPYTCHSDRHTVFAQQILTEMKQSMPLAQEVICTPNYYARLSSKLLAFSNCWQSAVLN